MNAGDTNGDGIGDFMGRKAVVPAAASAAENEAATEHASTAGVRNHGLSLPLVITSANDLSDGRESGREGVRHRGRLTAKRRHWRLA
jgi:hypothetical protein